MYEIEFSKEAVKHVLLMRKSSPQLFKKLEKLLDELREHPYTGTGHPEQLRYLEGVWSRQLDKKNRIRYMVNETTVIVFIFQLGGIMTTNKITRKQVSFRLREDLLMALREEARKANKSLNSFVESILADAMLKRTNKGDDVFIKNDTEVL